MTRGPENANARRAKLMAMLSGGKNVSTMQAAKKLGVNPMTIRRDLKALEDSKMAMRCYGGAVATHRITLEFAFDERRRQNMQAKRSLGQAGAAMIAQGQTVFIDTGTTTLELARSLASRGVRCKVVTSSLVIASELLCNRQIELMLLGGRVRQSSPDLVGPCTEIMLDQLTADIAFVGSDGIDPARGFFAMDSEAAGVAKRMVASAKRAVVLADHSKLGLAGGARYAATSDIDELITDSQADKAILSAIARKGVKVTVV